MKKLILILSLFTLFSCSKTSNMTHKTTIFYNNTEYTSNHYETTTEFLPENPSDPTNNRSIVKITMNTSETGGFIFTYFYTDRHTFSLKENINVKKVSFVGDIEVVDSVLIGKAYDNKGNYIIFSENTSGGGSGLTQEQVEGLIFKA